MGSVPLIVTKVENRSENASSLSLLCHPLPFGERGSILLCCHSAHLPVRRQARKHLSRPIAQQGHHAAVNGRVEHVDGPGS